MNIFFREIKRNMASFFIWLSINLFMAVYTIFMYPGFKDDISEILNVKFPPAMQKALGINISSATDILGFYSIIVPFLLLFGAIYVTILFGSLISKEENDKTAEFLLSKPVSRTGVAFSKFMAGFVYTVLFDAVTWGVSYAILEITKYTPYNKKALLLLAVSQLFAFLYFAAIGFLCSTFIYRSRTVIPLSVGIVMGMFILQSISELSKKASFFKYITPFEFYKPDRIISEKALDSKYIIITFSVFFVCLIAGFIRYNKKDIKN